jgi:hypothetical protein
MDPNYPSFCVCVFKRIDVFVLLSNGLVFLFCFDNVSFFFMTSHLYTTLLCMYCIARLEATVCPNERLSCTGGGGTKQVKRFGEETQNCTSWMLNPQEKEKLARENLFREKLEGTLGYRVHNVVGDGNCLFRALAYAIYGDEGKHSQV